VLVPPHPGLFSALGLLLANTRLDYVRTLEQLLRDVSRARIDAIFGEMESQAERDFDRQNIDGSDMRFERIVDIRVGFMRDEMTLTLEGPDSTDPDNIAVQFREAHQREFGFPGEGDLYIVNTRLRAVSATSPLSFQGLHEMALQTSTFEKHTRMAYFGAFGEMATPVISRHSIDRPLQGPLIIEEKDTTVIVPPDWTASRERLNGILLRYKG
jgi:N-methylhydantoinase A